MTIHRVANSVALHDIDDAYGHAANVDTAGLPPERRVRYAFDLARVHAERREVDKAVARMLAAERLAPEQVHYHVMSREIVADLRRTSEGKRRPELTQLAQRMHEADTSLRGSAE